MNDVQLIAQSLAYLCDAMKRLESAIKSDNWSERNYYVEECADRRKRVERIIVEKLMK